MNFIYELFKVETIHSKRCEKLEDILSLLNEKYINYLTKKYNTDTIGLKEKILKDFKDNLLKFTEDEHKSFYELYNGEVDYSNENLYINLKKFTSLGLVYLFTTNGGKLYEFQIPIELVNQYEDLLRTI